MSSMVALTVSQHCELLADALQKKQIHLRLHSPPIWCSKKLVMEKSQIKGDREHLMNFLMS